MGAEVKQLPERKDIPVEDTWRLEDIFPSDEAWEKGGVFGKCIGNIVLYKRVK